LVPDKLDFRTFEIGEKALTNVMRSLKHRFLRRLAKQEVRANCDRDYANQLLKTALRKVERADIDVCVVLEEMAQLLGDVSFDYLGPRRSRDVAEMVRRRIEVRNFEGL
jgi:hypothetical protein